MSKLQQGLTMPEKKQLMHLKGCYGRRISKNEVAKIHW